MTNHGCGRYDDQTGFAEYAVDVKIAIRATDEREAFELIANVVRDRIDGHLLSAQRQARVVGVSVDDGLLIDNINALHDAVRAYDDATVSVLNPPQFAEDLRNVVFDMWFYLHMKAIRS